MHRCSDADQSSVSYEPADSFSQSSIIDVELLITEILKRPVLYNPTDDNYRDQLIRDRAWEEIASLLGDSTTSECITMECDVGN